MWVVRAARVPDLPAIYELQNTPYRHEVFDSELPSLDQFLAEKEMAISQGREELFVLQYEHVSKGFLLFVQESDFWHVTIWGPWLKTLVYAAGVTAFDYLKYPRLVFCVREKNKRMVKVCEQYDFRLIGRNSVFVTIQETPYIEVAQVYYYDITAEEFRQRSQKMRERSFQLEFQWDVAE